MQSRLMVSVALAGALCLPRAAFACQRTSPVSAADMVRDAEAIVRVLAVEYVTSPQDPKIKTTGEPDSRIRFRVVEVIRGKDIQQELVLPGYLSDRDDFNDARPPYSFVRPNGRSGSCFANTYRSGAQFLLILKKRNGEYTVNWYALGPVNEQLRSEDDPWLLWVRQEAHRGVLPDTQMEPTRRPFVAAISPRRAARLQR